MTTKHSILLTNDDGISATGIQTLIKGLPDLYDLTTVAPKREQSGTSKSISMHDPIHLDKQSEKSYIIDGTPSDCMLFAFRKILNNKPDLVVSGINRGPNLGDDTLFSGTVGAAIIANMFGVKSIALSMENAQEPINYQTGLKVLKKLLPTVIKRESLKGYTVNINIPNLPFSDLKGLKVTTLGRRMYDPSFIEDFCKKDHFHYGKGKVEHDNIAGSDCSQIEQGFVTLSVLKPSLLDLDMNLQFAKEISSDIIFS